MRLVGSFEENVLNERLQQVRLAEGYRAQVCASAGAARQRPPLEAAASARFLRASAHCFPYLARVSLAGRGYRIPRKGTLQVTLFNPLGTVVRLFLLLYDLTDMPASARTFLRQRIVLRSPPTIGAAGAHIARKTPDTVRYLIQANLQSSKSGRVYVHGELRIFVSAGLAPDVVSPLPSASLQLGNENNLARTSATTNDEPPAGGNEPQGACPAAPKCRAAADYDDDRPRELVYLEMPANPRYFAR